MAATSSTHQEAGNIPSDPPSITALTCLPSCNSPRLPYTPFSLHPTLLLYIFIYKISHTIHPFKHPSMDACLLLPPWNPLNGILATLPASHRPSFFRPLFPTLHILLFSQSLDLTLSLHTMDIIERKAFGHIIYITYKSLVDRLDRQTCLLCTLDDHYIPTPPG